MCRPGCDCSGRHKCRAYMTFASSSFTRRPNPAGSLIRRSKRRLTSAGSRSGPAPRTACARCLAGRCASSATSSARTTRPLASAPHGRWCRWRGRVGSRRPRPPTPWRSSTSSPGASGTSACPKTPAMQLVGSRDRLAALRDLKAKGLMLEAEESAQPEAP